MDLNIELYLHSRLRGNLVTPSFALSFLSPSSTPSNKVAFKHDVCPHRCANRHKFKLPIRPPKQSTPSRSDIYISRFNYGHSPGSEFRKSIYRPRASAVSDEGETVEEKNSVNPTKWSEMPFRNIHEELDAIDRYEKDEELSKDDPWPKFLRGAAYERWGQPKLALAQYRLTNFASGLRQVPEIWERRAYNAFKIGEVVAANVYFDASMKLSNDADGNYLHFLHWFYEHFEYYMPKRNGPPAAIQHAICKYCVSRLRDARELLVAQISIEVPVIEHALLWMMATSFRLFPDKGLPLGDANLCNGAMKKGIKWDEPLGMLVRLFSSAALGNNKEAVKHYQQINEICDRDTNGVDITISVYLALYHDAFTRDTVERDAYLDKVCRLPGTASHNDIENFLYYTAKNRFSTPNSSMSQVPELLPT